MGRRAWKTKQALHSHTEKPCETTAFIHHYWIFLGHPEANFSSAKLVRHCESFLAKSLTFITVVAHIHADSFLLCAMKRLIKYIFIVGFLFSWFSFSAKPLCRKKNFAALLLVTGKQEGETTAKATSAYWNLAVGLCSITLPACTSGLFGLFFFR